MAMLSSEQARKWRRQAEKYRVLADCAFADSARETYEALADDYDKLAERCADSCEATAPRRH
jgi:hypothetical protein